MKALRRDRITTSISIVEFDGGDYAKFSWGWRVRVCWGLWGWVVAEGLTTWLGEEVIRNKSWTEPSHAILFFVSEAYPSTTTIRPALTEDAEDIARMFMESAEYHARLDPERYAVPAFETISARYREGRQHEPVGGEGITLVAEVDGEIVGFIDAGLERSPDLMHRGILYCHVAEIAVSVRHQDQGIGGLLLQTVEDWGRKMGAAFASLEFHTENKRAGLFYQKRMGYHSASITAIKRL